MNSWTHWVRAGFPEARDELRSALVPAALVLLAIVACGLAVVAIGGGQYTFPVDDPYIHLAVARQLWLGHYGINPGEFSAPSSSVLWPFLLAPFAGSSLGVFFAVAFNALCAVLSVALFGVCAQRLLSIEEPRRKRWWVLGGTLAFAVGTNQVGLALLGMEHSLQVLVAVWLAALVIQDGKGEAKPPAVSIAAAIALGPVVRYEMVGLSLLVGAYFVWRRRAAPAFLGLAAAGAALTAFSLMLLRHGQSALPTSVLAKSGTAPGQAIWVTMLANVKAQLHAGWAVILVLVAFGVLLYRRRGALSRRDWPLALLVLAALAGHLLVGRSGWFGRYEAYVLAFSYLLSLALFADLVTGLASRSRVWLKLSLSAFALVLCSRYVGIVLSTPLAARNIYEQQAQVARFVSDFYKQPVGVNDIGYVAWTSNSYVLDFIGLASREAFLAQRKYPTNAGAWVEGLTRAHDVRLAAVYDEWFYNLPSSWLRCGWLHLGGRRVTAANGVVAFYALDDVTRQRLPPLLREWAATLPPGVRFEFADGCR